MPAPLKTLKDNPCLSLFQLHRRSPNFYCSCHNQRNGTSKSPSGSDVFLLGCISSISFLPFNTLVLTGGWLVNLGSSRGQLLAAMILSTDIILLFYMRQHVHRLQTETKGCKGFIHAHSSVGFRFCVLMDFLVTISEEIRLCLPPFTKRLFAQARLYIPVIQILRNWRQDVHELETSLAVGAMAHSARKNTCLLWFPTPKWWLTTACNSSFLDLDALSDLWGDQTCIC